MLDLQRRFVLGGAIGSAGALIAPARSEARDPVGMTTVPSRHAMMLLASPLEQSCVYLAEPGREGVFRLVAGHPEFDDPHGGLTVAARAPGYHFARIWDGTHGRPEWFGAVVNDYRQDCADAIEACYALCPVTELGQVDYFIHRTLNFARSWRTVRGVGTYATDQGRGTRIILQNAAPGIHTADIMVVGTRAQPTPGSEGFVSENHFSHFTVIRDGRCTPHASGDLALYPTGLRAAYLVRSTFRGITALANSVGFYLGGLVYSKIDDCLAQRLEPGNGGRDRAVGYYLDGRPSFGLAGGNASLYLHRCTAVGQNPAHEEPTGLLGEGAFVDSFIDQFESAGINTGIHFSAAGGMRVGQTIDLHIRGAVLDGCGRAGIELDLGGTASSSIEIIDPYIYAPTAGGKHGIHIHGGGGLATLTGGQLHGRFTGGSLALAETRGISVQGLKIHQALRPVSVVDCTGLQLMPQISIVDQPTPAAAITCTKLTRSVLRPTVLGSDGSFGSGISLDAASRFCSIDGSAIDPDCLVGGAASMLRYAGNSVREPAFTAAGNVAIGANGR